MIVSFKIHALSPESAFLASFFCVWLNEELWSNTISTIVKIRIFYLLVKNITTHPQGKIKKRRFEPVQNSRWLFKTNLQEEAEAPVCIVQVWWPKHWQLMSAGMKLHVLCDSDVGEWMKWMDFYPRCSTYTVIWGSICLKSSKVKNPDLF